MRRLSLLEGGLTDPSDDRNLANARLLAAAPALLDVATAALDYLTATCGTDAEWLRACLRRTIAAATRREA